MTVGFSAISRIWLCLKPAFTSVLVSVMSPVADLCEPL